MLTYREVIPARPVSPHLLYRNIYGGETDTFLLESGLPNNTNSRFSFLGSFKKRKFKYEGEKIFNISDGQETILDKDPLNYLQEVYQESLQNIPPLFPFSGGLVGYIGYELIAPHKGKNIPMPILYFGVTDELIAIDHEEGKVAIFAAEGRIDELTEKILNTPKRDLLPEYKASNLESSLSEKEFIKIVERCKEYITEGDIYQANLSQRFVADFDGDPLGLYLRLRETNPSPFQGYINFGDMQIVSSSPERLIKIDGDNLETRPIAGTRPRGKSEEEDKNLSKELLLNKKEAAEHLMLVDLERNDLGKISEYGSVKVEEFMALEGYSEVWHIVSKVVGKKKDGVGLAETIRAIFPGGTITGCPKIRCMEIIDELEPVSRGFYTGSMGYLGWNGNIDLNILIRSAAIKDGKIYFHAGAGIVADSDPAAEYKETMKKATHILKALNLY